MIYNRFVYVKDDNTLLRTETTFHPFRTIEQEEARITKQSLEENEPVETLTSTAAVVIIKTENKDFITIHILSKENKGE